jgi:hypothetical protein
MEPSAISRKVMAVWANFALGKPLRIGSVSLCGLLQRQTMLVRVSEVGSVLGLVLLLIIGKHIPALSGLPLTSITGIVCFAFAIFLSLRIFQHELARLRAEE